MNKQEMSEQRADPQFLRFDTLSDADVRLLTHDDLKGLMFLLDGLRESSHMAARLYHHLYEVKLRYPVADFRLKPLVGKPD